MSLDLKMEIFGQLDWYWHAMFLPRLQGMTDEEHLWEPVADCWTVRLRPDGRWAPDAGFPPEPAPLTTIAWRLCHIWSCLAMRANYHFGDRSLTSGDVDWPGTAVDAVTFVERGYAAWKEGIDALPDDALYEKSEGPPGSLDAQFPFFQVICHINREVIHHGAEVALLRDLYRWTRLQEPFIAACLRADRETVDELRAADPAVVEPAIARHPDAVLVAAEAGRQDAVHLLGELGFDVNAGSNRAPLHTAAGKGDLGMVRLLVDLGADLTARDPEWESTPLGWAQYFERAEVIEYLAPLTAENGPSD